jgi:hypothetical protein
MQGGGLCELDNLRTLCVACHADVTKAQLKERTAERRREALRTRDIRGYLSPVAGKAGTCEERSGCTATRLSADVDSVQCVGYEQAGHV